MRSTLRPILIAALCLLALGGPRPASAETLRVGTSGDYPPFSVGDREQGLEGFDVSVARAYAEERGLELVLVPFRWPELLTKLAAREFDVAMSGVTVRPERSTAGRFSIPVLETHAVVIVREPDRWDRAEALDTRAARIGVNAGGHLERVARAQFDEATLVVIPENDAVPFALLASSVDAIVSEDQEAALWIKKIDGARIYGPLSRDRKAYLVHSERPGLAADLDSWLLAREADGTLAALREQHLEKAVPSPPTTPLAALFAAVDERLGLMPIVGASKREEGVPLEVPEREAQVLDAAVGAVAMAAQRSGVKAPPEDVVRAFFRAQIDAAKQVQLAAVRDDDFSPPEPLPDLETQLRPALLRIGEKTAALLLALPRDLDEATVRQQAAADLRSPYLQPAAIRALADAVLAVSKARR